MNLFPAVDPIPLPAPVGLFKALHIVTLALHFISVEMLLGGLLAATWLSLLAVTRRGHPAAALQINAASSLARRLPVVMTYVINLGVPPLLFAQVLYGRALYTSSVLIGVYWIGVVFLLMACYWLLYQFSYRAEAVKIAWPLGILSWLLAASIAKIYTTNMTLMLRPEVWNGMYSRSAIGAHLPPSDPTVMPRWGFMLAGGLVVAGLWMIWLAGRKNISEDVRRYLSANGGRLIVVMVFVQVYAGWMVFSSQPAIVQQGLMSKPLYHFAGYVWLGAMGLMLLFGLWAGFAKPIGSGMGLTALLLGTLAMGGMTVFRDGIRDLTLLSKGFDVWNREVQTNFGVVGLFLVLFIAGLGVTAWLISVVRSAKPISEKVV